MSSDKLEKARTRCLYFDDESGDLSDALYDLIAAVREEQGQPEAESNLCPDRCHHRTCKKAEQQVGHVARCHCHDKQGPCCHLPDDLQHQHPYTDPRCNPEPQRAHVAGCVCGTTNVLHEQNTDPRCLPGLLWEAKVRLEGFEKQKQIANNGDLWKCRDDLKAHHHKLRAAVEKLEKLKA